MILIIIFYCIIVINLAIFIYWRIDRIHKEQMRVLKIISSLTKKDIENRLDWLWRYDEFEKIADTMRLKFWKPINSFFAHAKCCK